MRGNDPDTPTTSREERLDEVLADYLEAVDRGDRPDPADWMARHPELAEELTRFFAGQERFAGLLGPLGHPAAGSATAVGDTSGTAPRDGGFPSRFGDYELLGEIARGGMGVVYRARQVSLNRLVAVKMILAGRLASAEDVRRFRQEAEAAANLDHPNIVPIYEVGEHDGRPYFAMKLIEGESLAALIQRHLTAEGVWDRIPILSGVDRIGILSHDRAARLLIPVARAVHHAHQRGILHRDLKPANVLLDADGRPHLTDFGLARRLHADPGLTPSGTAVGTPSYAAPEQAAGPGKAVTTAADVFSLGAILYELLTGRPPFRAETPLETLRRLLEEEPVPPRALNPKVDRDLETVCLKCLARDPARRYGSAEALADDLDRFVRGEPVRARRVGRAERLLRWCRRRPVTAALAGGLLLSVAVGLGLVGWQWWRAEANRARAEEQRARADEGFREAHRAVNDFCTRVSEGRMRDVAGLQPVRKELLEAALAYEERFLRQRGDDPGLRAELADTRLRIATIAAVLGPKSQAMDAYGPAQAAYEDLLRDDPGNVAARTALAEIRLRVGVLQAQTGRPEARASLEDALGRYEALLGERPDDAALRRGVAAACNNLGALHRRVGRVDEALGFVRRALDVQEELARAYPRDAELRASLAVTCCGLAGLRSALGGRDEALALYRRALDVQEQLVKADPVNLRYQQDLAATCRHLGGELCADRHFDDALRTVQRGQALLEQLVRAEPTMPGLRCDLASGHRQAGHVYRDSGRLAEALGEYYDAHALMDVLAREQPDVADYRNDLAKCHFDEGVALGRVGLKEEALASYRAAAALRRALVDEDPECLEYRSDLGLTLGNEAGLLAALGRRDEALAALRDGVAQHRAAWSGAPRVERYRRQLGGAYAALAARAAEAGQDDEALAAAGERRKLGAGNPDELYAAAADLARLAGRADGKRYAEAAVAALREAASAGFRDGARLRADPAFAGLRGRADFDAVVTDLERRRPE
jgi:serine/threonine-protein kinase